MIARVLLSGVVAVAAMVLMIVGGWFIRYLVVPAVMPGAVLAMVLGSIWYFLRFPQPPAVGDDGPAVFAAASVVLSLLFWWAVALAVLTIPSRRKPRAGVA